MIKKTEMKIIKTKQIATDTIEMQLEDDYITQTAVPGQFIYIAVPGFTLRRPISIADTSKENNQLTILFKILGKGTKELAKFKAGMTLDVLGPNGNGFPLDPQVNSTVVLIGGGIGVPPLYYLGKKLTEKNVNVISVLGFQSKDHVFYEEAFKALGQTIIVTDDGSYGEKGFVTDVLSGLPAFDMFYSCGPTGMLQAVTKRLENKPGYISLEERMGCGVGTCAACVIPTNTAEGYKKICHDGPVFSAKEVIL